MKKQPFISVIIPAFNAENYIEDTLNSVVAQEYSNLEIIVVDDGSKDDTVGKVKKFGNKVTLYCCPNGGVSTARNFAARQAKGDWLAFVDSDDIWLPNKLSLQMSGIGDMKWSHTNSLYIGERQDGRTKRSDLTPQFGGFVFDKLVLNNFITTSTVIIHKELFLKAGGFNVSLDALEDWQLWLSIAYKNPLHYQQEVLAQYRVHGDSTSRQARKSLPLHLQVINNTFSHYPELRANTKMKKLAQAESFTICSYIAEHSEDYNFAIYCAFKAWCQRMYSLTKLKRLVRTVIRKIFRV